MVLICTVPAPAAELPSRKPGYSRWQDDHDDRRQMARSLRGGPETGRHYHEQWHEDQRSRNAEAQYLAGPATAIAIGRRNALFERTDIPGRVSNAGRTFRAGDARVKFIGFFDRLNRRGDVL